MAKVQVIMPITLNGFLPNENEELMQWMRTNKQGFPYWEEEATFKMYPHYGMLDIMMAKQGHEKNCTYFMKIDNEDSARYSQGLFLFHLVDEIVIYMLPISYNEGMKIFQNIRSEQWNLSQVKTFKNHICRLVYNKK